jgi:transcriptional regulator with XRE-family HTH domain
VLTAPDILRLARRRAGLTQQELGERLGKPRSTIARWELGEMEPSYDAVMRAIGACGLELTFGLANADHSYIANIDDQLRLDPPERLRRLGHDGWLRAVRDSAARAPEAILVGDAAAALQGWPLSLPPAVEVEACLPDGSGRGFAGVHGYGDLRRERRTIDLGDGATVHVASSLDLLRIEDARHRRVQAGALIALVAYERRFPKGPPPRREYTDDEAREAIEAWLHRTTQTAKH